MCGIAGIWGKQHSLTIETLVRFNDAMLHRGPDGAGTKIFDEQLGLAHRRLSILDTSKAGAQPMSDSTGRYHLTFNGEVFNFIEIRKELESLGDQFTSDTDTEVILAAYRRWGVDAFHRFNGMWAMAIWDSQDKELLLCRDRFGIKPLYYLENSKCFAFASETNAFKHLEGFERRFNEQHVQISLADTYALEGRGHTLFEDIFQLLPGHFIRLTAGAKVQQRRWYDIEKASPSVPSDYAGQVKRYRELFEEACRLRMRSDVPLATALSGGVDSTAVYSMVHRLMQARKAERTPADWQRAFVAVFPGTVQDETAYAEKAVAHTGGQAEYLDPRTDNLLQDILKTTINFDAISATPILALMTVYKGMRAHGVTVSLDGHGVDEMLYGYRKMVYDAFEYNKWHGDMDHARASAKVLAGLYAPELRAAKTSAFVESINQASSKRRGLFAGVKKVIRRSRPLKTDIRPGDLLKPLSDSPYDFSNMNVFERMVYEEFFLDTLPSLLRNFDKASMMSSIEIRMPFMDFNMVEYAFGLPFEAKLGAGYTKRILRDAMEGIMPEENRIRTFKVGLAAPTMEWFQGPLCEWVKDVSHAQSFTQSSYWESEKAKEIQSLASSGDWTVPKAAEAWKYFNAQLILNE